MSTIYHIKQRFAFKCLICILKTQWDIFTKKGHIKLEFEFLQTNRSEERKRLPLPTINGSFQPEIS